jgi:phosphatidylethanolamine-binding protein (PEBP) family uncharacterized protein
MGRRQHFSIFLTVLTTSGQHRAPSSKARHAQLADAMRGHVLAEGELMGTYRHGGEKE